MKKAIAVAIVISALIVASAYYYFFIVDVESDIRTMPSKVKIAVNLPQPIENTPLSQKETQKTQKEQEKKAVQKKEVSSQKVELPQKVETPKVESKKEPIKKEEAKGIVKEPSKETKQPEEKKPIAKVKGYRLFYLTSDEEQAIKIKNELISKGYHTAKNIKVKDNYYVILSPFTDKWEAEYVRDNISKETTYKFALKAFY